MRGDRKLWWLVPAGVLSAGLLWGVAGCPLLQPLPLPTAPRAPGSTAQTIAEQCAVCHAPQVDKFSAGSHRAIENQCLVCHENGRDHMARPSERRAKVSFALSACSGCHAFEHDTYLHDDSAKAGRFGGSVATSKYDEFVHYRYLMGGHGFTREYNEDRAHAYILKDHIDIARTQTTTCLQCKSTPVAYYWNERRFRSGVPFNKSQPWADVIRRIREEHGETIDYGVGCTHCHDPHSGDFRLIRKAVVTAILERGTDPYSRVHNVVPASEAELQALLNERRGDGRRTARAMRLAGTLTCGQCHIEYVCGPGADRTTTGEIRDDVPWRKQADIEAYYTSKFDNQQDWRHSITGLTGVKPQHPETEAYWESPHHMLGMSCADCHMARTQGPDGRTRTSHWLTSPLKNNIATCSRCHNDVQAELFSLQDAVYAQALRVESTLNAVLRKIEAANASRTVPIDQLDSAKALFMRALTWWEWTVVSENSMGAHNADETRLQLDTAEDLADQALRLLP